MKANYCIVIPYHNDSNSLPAVIRSIEQIQESPAEVIVVDDGSEVPLNLADINVGKKLSLKCIRMDENKGPASARNRGIEETSADYILFLDADDVLVGGISIQGILDRCPDVAFNCFHKSWIKTVVIACFHWLPIFLFFGWNGVITSGTFFRRDLFGEFRFRDNEFLAEDYELWIRLVIAKRKYVCSRVFRIVQYGRDNQRLSSNVRNNLDRMDAVLTRLYSENLVSWATRSAVGYVIHIRKVFYG